jgi:hypothetical protein
MAFSVKQELAFAIGAIAWTVFAVWTIRRLSKASEREDSPWVFRGGVGFSGIFMWLLTTLVAAKAFYEAGADQNFWLWLFACALIELPICLWAGYWVGRVIQSFSNSLRR